MSILRITNLKQGVKNPNRVNVFINDKYAFSLDISQVVDYKIRVGKVVSEEELNELKNASEFGKLYQRTLEWVLIRPRSIKETKDYLFRRFKSSFSGPLKGACPSFSPSKETFESSKSNSSFSGSSISEFSSEIINRLISKNYLDDRVFARWYVENRFTKKGISKKRLKIELTKKGISREIIDEVLVNRRDEEEILKMIAKKRAKYDNKKLVMYLVRQGFSFKMANNAVKEYEENN